MFNKDVQMGHSIACLTDIHRGFMTVHGVINPYKLHNMYDISIEIINLTKYLGANVCLTLTSA
jgi:hypothetical protein